MIRQTLAHPLTALLVLLGTLAPATLGDEPVAPEGRQGNVVPKGRQGNVVPNGRQKPVPERRQNPAPEVGNRSTTVLVAYHSVKGHTEAMAEAVAAGARSVVGTEVRLKTVTEAETDDLLWADAIAIGSPVYNANVAPEVQSFINAWPFRGAPMRNKLGAAFVTGGAISAGEETVQLSILRSMLVFGMVVTGGSSWRSAFGASAVTEEDPFSREEVEEQFLERGRALGLRLAELAARMRPPPEISPPPDGSID